MDSRLKFKRSLLVITLGGLIVFNCSFSDHKFPNKVANTFPKDSGVQGQALRGPSHNGPPQAGDNAYIGFEALFYVNNEYGGLVTTFHSDANGWFLVQLAPGDYQIVPDSSAPIADAAQQVQHVSVVKGKITPVTFHFDSVW